MLDVNNINERNARLLNVANGAYPVYYGMAKANGHFGEQILAHRKPYRSTATTGGGSAAGGASVLSLSVHMDM